MGKILPFGNRAPKIAHGVFIAPDALVMGDVEIGERSSIWYGSVVRGDVNWIKIGKKTNIQDRCVCHVSAQTAPLLVGDEVTCGHGAILHGCVIEDRVLVGMGAVVLDNAKVGEGSIIAAGALVPPNKQIPPGSLVAGVPAKVKRQTTDEETEQIKASAEHYYRLSLEHGEVWGLNDEAGAIVPRSSNVPEPIYLAGTRGITAVLFDMDGVVIDSMGEHARAWIQAAGRFGVQVTEEEVFKREGEQGVITARDFLAKLEGARPTKKAIREFLDVKEEIFKSSSRIKPFGGIETVIDNLRSYGFKLGLVTGTSKGELDRVLPKGIADRFDVIVAGDSVTRGKPHPEPYLVACANLGVDPKNAVVIENAPYGIRSAKAAGVYCIAITTYLPSAELEGADVIIESHGEIVPTVLEVDARKKVEM